MSTATNESIPPEAIASIAARLRPSCFVIANSRTSRSAAAAAIVRALAVIASRSST
jgi:hypothetical protein